MLLGADDELGFFKKLRVPKLVKTGWKFGRWANPLTAGATLAAKGARAVSRKRRRGGLRGAYPELEDIAGEEDFGDDFEDADELGFFKKLVRVAGKGAKFASGFVPGPGGMALKIAGGALDRGKKAAPPPPCTFGQKVSRFFGKKPPCT